MHVPTLALRRATRSALAAIVLLASACAPETPANVAPELPATPGLPIQYRNAAFTLAVDATKRRVTVSAPAGSVTQRVAAPSALVGSRVNPSLLGGDAVDLVVTNYTAGVLGEVVPGKIRVTFDIQIINRLGGYRLDTPTFPTPPSGVSGVLAFPIEISVLNSSGGVVSSGNEITVSSPRFGRVVHSSDWEGELHSFFNDTGCPSTASDCFRYEPFTAIEPLGSSPPQRVGFLIDPEVGDFRVKVIVGADLVPAAAPTPGTVRGTITSNIGPLGGAVVTVTGGGSATTNASGAYSISNVPSGNARTVILQALPSGCVSLLPTATLNIAAGATITQDFVATCTIPTAPLQGIVSNTLGAPLAGVQVTVTPTGGVAQPAGTTSATGAWQLTQVPYLPATEGSITLANLPSGCTAGAFAYTGLGAAGLTRDIVVSCAVAPITYPLVATWGSIAPTGPTGRQVTLTLAIDMGVAPGSADVDGAAADALTGLSLTLGYDGSVLDWTSRLLLSPIPFDIGDIVENNPGTASALVSATFGSSAGGNRSGAFELLRLTFDVAPGASGTLAPQLAVTRAGAGSLDVDVTARVIVTVPPLNIP